MLRKRPYLKKEWCIQVIENPLKVESQENNRFRFWGLINEFEGRVFSLELCSSLGESFSWTLDIVLNEFLSSSFLDTVKLSPIMLNLGQQSIH